MIIGIGIDILEVARMKRDLADKQGLAEVLFTPSEIAYCRGKRYPHQHFAARFAAKEGLFKALGTGMRGKMSWQDIEISLNETGKPDVKLSGATKKIAVQRKIKTVHVSLSHTKEYAAAAIVLEG